MTDKLTSDDRAYLDEVRRGGSLVRNPERLLRIIDELAPAPAPPEPRVSELPARWRDDGDWDEAVAAGRRVCADELEAALKRERERLGSEESQEHIANKIRHLTACSLNASHEAARWLVRHLLKESP